ncbi:PulJ/GspJ family protein [Breznakiella homolactica]|uniref:Prepilin-type N-terminal cleavage/methylation domain-containing protein n=1 Tax=Breznakiella homolactica TaxID=2798577 RepID=A0A7T8BC40_9SPIR|nr:prepilin-type N-terminal cleavage/methylation domain-containing protein [Breznakiella homolactica]QQO10745.1 prepilin-type N-terminal cleavage/methylation domain-containing protein [Breznakiella homolactica]
MILQTDRDGGFTLMETLISIAVMLIISGCVIFAFTAAMKASAKSAAAANAAREIIRVDRFIRNQAEELHIPYWAYSSPYIAEFKNSLWRSEAGKYITVVESMYTSAGLPCGVKVTYEIGGRTMQTSALFPAVPVVERVR